MTSLREAFAQDWKGFSTSRASEGAGWKAIGIIAWTLAYILVILAHRHTGFSLIPKPLVAYNVVWEAARVFLWTHGSAKWMLMFMGIGWFALDLIIVWDTWTLGDGSGDDLWLQRMTFLRWILVFSGIVWGLHTIQDDSLTRIWKYLSYVAANIMKCYWMQLLLSSYPIPYLGTILVSTGLGELAFLLGMRYVVKGWHHPREHPAKFLYMLLIVLPTIVCCAFSLSLPVWAAHFRQLNVVD